MKAAVSVIQAIIILAISASLVYIALSWSIETIRKSSDIAEVNTIESQFDDCNERIIDTARTGSTNKCLFNIKNGIITGNTDGVYYNIISSAPICDPSSLTEIDPRNHIWQQCNISGDKRLYTMVWKYPSTLDVNGTNLSGNQIAGQTPISNITFASPLTFDTLSLYVNFQSHPGQAGNTVEFSRVDLTETNVTLNLKIS